LQRALVKRRIRREVDELLHAGIRVGRAAHAVGVGVAEEAAAHLHALPVALTLAFGLGIELGEASIVAGGGGLDHVRGAVPAASAGAILG